jgi:hypothetical protein
MKDKGTKKPETKQKELNLFSKETFIPEDQRIFVPNANNKPPEAETVISFNGSRFLTTGNLSAIISRAGTGKSSLCEAIMAKHLNPNCDGLGFDIELKGYRDKIIYIDGERTIYDTWNSWERMRNRAGIELSKDDSRVIMANFKPISIQERINNVSELLKKNDNVGLIILDGGGEFVTDINSIVETTCLKNWIYSFNSSISVLTTIHSNPDSNKPRGTVGSELWRTSEGIVLLRKIQGTEIREITTDFDYGKIRNDSDKINHFYTWEPDKQMFVSAKYDGKLNLSKTASDKQLKLIEEIYNNGHNVMTSSQITRRICEISQKTPEAAKKYFQREIKGLLEKFGDGYKIKQ